MSNTEAERELLNSEFQQAWEHYRHVENARTTYMQFFYTAIFAAFGLLIALHEHSNELSLQSIIISCWLLSFFTTYIYLNIAKIKIVLDHYIDVIDGIRKYTYSNYPKKAAFLDFKKTINKKDTVLGSVQGSTELILKFFIIIFDVVVCVCLNEVSMNAMLTLTATTLVVCLIGIQFYIIIIWKK